MKTELLLLLLTFFYSAKEEVLSCGEGCISCDFFSSPPSCLLCDNQNSYFLELESQKCFKNEIENCLETGFSFSKPKCEKCVEKFFFDERLNKCVENLSLIENCAFYESETNCLECEPDFFLSNGKCESINSLSDNLRNCLVYSEFTGCQKCRDGYFLLMDNNESSLELSCIEFENYVKINDISTQNKSKISPNCKIFTDFVCKECDENYFLKNSLIPFSENLFVQTSFLPKLLTFIYNDNQIFANNQSKNCFAKKIDNCKTFQISFENELFCSVCKNGYFLENEICKENPTLEIEHCLYYKNSKECIMCAEGFWLVSPIHCEEEEYIPHCIKNNNDFMCIECESIFYLNYDDQICIERENQNKGCLQYSHFDDFCFECEGNYYLYDPEYYRKEYEEFMINEDDQGKKAFRCYENEFYPIQNCSKHDSYSPSCLECEADFILSVDQSKCLSPIEKCLDQVEEMNNLENGSICLRCEYGYFPSENKLKCLENKISFCKEYSAYENLCLKCENMFYFIDEEKLYAFDNLSGTKYCHQFESPNCLENHENKNSCKTCKSGYFLHHNDNSEYKYRMDCIQMKTKTDPNCLENDSSNDNGQCSKCLEGSQSFLLSSFSLRSKVNDNCLFFDPVYSFCVQCKDFYFNLVEFCDNFDPENICKRVYPNTLNENYSTIMNRYNDMNNNCIECSDYENYYLDIKSCKTRNKFLYENCSEKNKSKDRCFSCEEDHQMIDLNKTLVCVEKPDNFNEIENCKEYNILNLSECANCAAGYELENGKCLKLETNHLKFFMGPDYLIKNRDIILVYNKNVNKSNLLERCGTWKQINTEASFENYLCASCKKEFVSIVETSLLHSFNSMLNQYDFHSNYYMMKDCIDKSEFDKFVNSDSKINYPEQFVLDNKCLIAEKIDNNYFCKECIEGFIPIIKKISYKFLDQNEEKEINVVVDCVIGYDFIKSVYKGIGYDKKLFSLEKNQTNEEEIKNYIGSDIEPIYFDSCKINEQILIHMSNLKLNTTSEKYFCKQKYSIPNLLENCQILSWISPTLIDFSDEDNLICSACSPGYKPIFSLNEEKNQYFISKCEIMESCDLSHESNNIMNFCSIKALKSNYIFETSEKNLFNIVENSINSFPNCLVKSENECLFCKTGFALDEFDKSCKPFIINNCSQANDFGKEYKKLHIFHVDELFEILGINEVLNDQNLNLPGSGCAKCQSDRIPAAVPKKETVHVCVSQYSTKTSNLSDCLKYGINYIKEKDENENIKCVQCKEDFIISGDGRCFSEKDFPNCKFVHSREIMKCIDCKEGFYLDSDYLCNLKKTSNCMSTQPILDEIIPMESFLNSFYHIDYEINIKNSSNLCAICEPNYVTSASPLDQGKCIPNPDKNDICRIKNYEGICLECKDQNKLPLNVVYKDKYINTYCLDSFDEDHEWSFLNKNVYSVTKYEDGIEFTSKIPGNGYFYIDHEISTDFDQDFSPPRNICVKIPKVSNCLVFDFDSHLFCKNCHDKYYLKNGVCWKGKIDNCLVYHSELYCKKCEENYIAYGFGRFCKKMNLDPFCDENGYNNQSGICEKCKSGYYLAHHFSNSDLNECKAFDESLNCLKFDPKDGKCLSCDEEKFYFFYETKICYPKSELVKNCKHSEQQKKKCLQCESGFFLHSPYECFPFIELENCSTYDELTGLCSFCEKKFYLGFDDGEMKCLENPKGIPHCKYFSSKSQCKQCEIPYALSIDKSECLFNMVEVEHCETYEDSYTCHICEKGFFLENNVCLRVLNPTCFDWFDRFNCRTCKEGFFLINENGIWECTSMNIPNCIISGIEKYDFGNEVLEINPNDQNEVTILDTILKQYVLEKIYKRSDAICLQCDDHMYYSNVNKKCLFNNSEKTPNCKKYSNSKECIQCLDGYYFDQQNNDCKEFQKKPSQIYLAKKESESLIEYIKHPVAYELKKSEDTNEIEPFFNCKNPLKVYPLQCFQCKEGFYLNQMKECKLCSVKNCSLCSDENPNLCYVCKSGYKMVKRLIHHSETEHYGVYCVGEEEVIKNETENINQDDFLPFIKINIVVFIFILLILQ